LAKKASLYQGNITVLVIFPHSHQGQAAPGLFNRSLFGCGTGGFGIAPRNRATQSRWAIVPLKAAFFYGTVSYSLWRKP
jgi:hypothetical protein